MRQIKYYYGKCALCALTIIYAFFSVVKLLQGYGNNIIDSYGILQKSDYVEIGMLTVGALILAALVIYTLHRFHAENIIESMVAYVFMLLFFLFVIDGEIYNKTYCIIYILSVAGAVIKYMLSRKGIVFTSEYFSFRQWKMLVPTLAFFVVSIVFCIPIELYLSNPGDFQFLFWNYFWVLCIGCILIVTMTLVLSVCLLNKKQVELLSMALFAMTFMGYIQRMMLNRGMGILDGDGQEWSVFAKIINSLIWGVLLVVILCARIFYKKIGNIYAIVCIYLSLIQLVSVGYLILTGNTNSDASFKAFTKESSLEVDTGKNVIVLLLDRFDAELLENLMESDRDFTKPLQDFTFYPNATCAFARTATAIPYLLTGAEWKEGIMESDYSVYAYENGHFLSKVMEAGYDVALYTEEDYVEEPYRKGIINYDDDIEQKCDFGKTLLTMMKCSKYTSAPLVLKDKYTYYSTAINDMVDNEDIWRIDDDLIYYQDLINKGLVRKEVENKKGTFYFYHFFGTHGPTNMTEDMERAEEGSVSLEEQTRASLKVIYEYLNQLKAIDKYEDTTIIITADHGIQLDGEVYKENGVVDRVTRPTILIKHAYENNDEMKINKAPVSQAEVIPTILDSLDIDYAEFGRTLEEVQEDEERIRTYVSIWEDKYDKFTIDGDADIKESWKLVETNY